MKTVTVRKLQDIEPKLIWEPSEGAETRGFVERKAVGGIPKLALLDVVFEAQQILGRCVEPKAPAAQSTGLVVGYVQSGKTLSFTTLCALAHDNGFGLVILIAGTLENLRKQTRTRLETDLGLGEGADAFSRPWLVVDNPSVDNDSATSLHRHLKNWADPKASAQYKKVCLVVLLKQHTRLTAMGNCLKQFGTELLSKVPTLVIDDEADQASLNTFTAQNVNRGTTRRSTNYASIVALKKSLPHHTYVQYTATPQANLLIDLNDHLSPEFGELLTPGSGYVGGSTVFEKGKPYAQSIPPSEANAAETDPAPASLQVALRYFLLGACAAHLSGKPAQRTMMVHPSQQTDRQRAYLKWLRGLVSEWGQLMDGGVPADVLNEFLPTYKELCKSVTTELPSLSELGVALPEVLRNVAVREVNSTATGGGPVRWGESPFWVLVGGAKLDRGFTVEGLTVTYMPRPLATGNADNLQQRARFFGYKQSYLGFCRVFLLPDVFEAFQEYVEHEKEIHISLRETRGQPLKQWVRQFTLHSSMQPTRNGVVGIPITELISGGWSQARAAHRDDAIVTDNMKVCDSFRALLSARYPGGIAQNTYPGKFLDSRPGAPGHLLHEQVPLEIVVDELLKRIKACEEDDAFELAGAILALRKLISSGEQLSDVFIIDSFKPQNRALTAQNKINQVYQGRSRNYGGDKQFASEARVSVHLRAFDLRTDGGGTVASVPWYSLHVPNVLTRRYLLQDA